MAKQDPKEYYGNRGTGTFEAIDVVEDFQLGFHKGNAVMYILRAGYKGSMANEAEDLEKAIRFLRRRIYLIKGEKGW